MRTAADRGRHSRTGVAPGRRCRGLHWGLRAIVIAGLVADAVVHLRLAPGYQAAAPGGIGEGTLFRIEAALAVVAALAVLATGAWVAALLAFLVAAAGLAAVLVYRYVDLPAFGPVPAMYEPVWFPEKVISAVAEGLAGLAAAALLPRPGGGTDSP